ncbi:MAG TPA: hypothetical protein VL984_10685, partial [Acidimicrobiales bacterium]|nr:hypothetical protein [Acidimicrobiales bacterium]
YNLDGSFNFKSTLTEEWDATATTYLNSTAQTYWRFTKLTGSVTYSGAYSDGHQTQAPCSATLGPAPDSQQQPAVYPTVGPWGTPSQPGYVPDGDIDAVASMSWVHYHNSDDDPESFCSGVTQAGVGGDACITYPPGMAAEIQAAEQPEMIVPYGGPFTKHFNVGGIATGKYNGTSQQCATTKVSLTSSLTVDSATTGSPPASLGGGSSPPVVPQDSRQRVKNLANTALKQNVRQALYPCVVATTGATLATYGYGTLSYVPLVTGTAMLAYTGPICVSEYRSIVRETQTVEDPPLYDYTKLAVPARAHLAAVNSPCSKFTGDAHALCLTLASDLDALSGKVSDVETIDAALETTISRWTAALADNDNTSVKEQQDQAGKLEDELATAKQAQTTASAAVEKILVAHKVAINVSAARDAEAITTLEEDVSKAGVSASELESLAGSALDAQSFNEMTTLESPY